MKYDKATQVQIILVGEALVNARREMRKSKASVLRHQGHGKIKAAWLAYRETRDFKGPRFQANTTTEIYVAVGAGTVNVGVHTAGRRATDTYQAQEYVYPLSTVGRIRITAKE